jgi:pyrophosphatase PpaX
LGGKRVDLPDLELNNLRTVIFDLDGTLIDSYPAHFQAYRATFYRFGIDLTEDDFLATYSPNWLDTYRALGLPQELWEEADAYWLDEASRLAPELFPGVLETLGQLRRTYRLGLVTSGSRERVFRDLGKRKLQDFFETIVTGDDVQRPKPAADGLRQALEVLRVDAGEAIYVGDSGLDWEMSTNAGVPFVGVHSRFASLDPSTPCYQIAAITDLPGLLKAK